MSMPFAPTGSSPASASRALVGALFVASCLLSIVSWYTTQQGMALYLSPWFSFLASLGIQSALVLVAWLVGLNRSGRGLLVAVYVVTGIVSVAFSYVSLYTWFSARERPAMVERRLYDQLTAAAGRSQELLAAAVAEGQKHALALEEMTAVERSHGYVSRAQDADPYLARIREAVAREAQTYDQAYREGQGPGLRYTAFERYAQLARQTVARLQQAQQGVAELGTSLKPLDPTESQLRRFRQVYDAIPWNDVKETLHSADLELPQVPTYSEFVDRSATGQEELLIAFGELVEAPTGRHITALALATFIDVVVFLLAYASGPFFFGSPEQRWVSAGATLDATDERAFLRGFLRKLSPGDRGAPLVAADDLSPGETQLLLLLAARRLAVPVESGGRSSYALDPTLHQRLAEALADDAPPLRMAAVAARQ
jgi:hypothetical protein